MNLQNSYFKHPVRSPFTLFGVLLLLSPVAQAAAPAPRTEGELGAFLSISLLALGLFSLMIITMGSDENPATAQDVQERDIDVLDFDRLDIFGTLNVIVAFGPVARVSTRGTEEELNRVRIRRVGSRLKVSSRWGFWFWWRTNRALVTITMPTLMDVEVSGACIVRMNGFDALPSLSLDITGASDVAFKGHVTDLNVDVTGASKLLLEGSTEHLYADITGASVLKAQELQANSVVLELSGACTADLHAVAQLRADLTGANTLRYRGNPLVSMENSGANSVTRF